MQWPLGACFSVFCLVLEMFSPHLDSGPVRLSEFGVQIKKSIEVNREASWQHFHLQVTRRYKDWAGPSLHSLSKVPVAAQI